MISQTPVDPTIPTNPYGCGIGWLWKLPEDHPFYAACVEHDKAYDARAAGLLPLERTSDGADAELGAAMQKIAHSAPSALERTKLEIEAHIFNGLTNLWGKLFWPHPKPKEEIACQQTPPPDSPKEN